MQKWYYFTLFIGQHFYSQILQKTTDVDNLVVCKYICKVQADSLRDAGEQLFCLFIFFKQPMTFYFPQIKTILCILTFHIFKLISYLYVASSVPITVLPLGNRASCYFVSVAAHPPSISDAESRCLSGQHPSLTQHSFTAVSYLPDFGPLHPTHLLFLLLSLEAGPQRCFHQLLVTYKKLRKFSDFW